MIIGGINIPDPLLESQEEGTLVIFVGAGVSQPRIPNFKELSKHIARYHRLRHKRGESWEHYLGRLESDGLKVKKIAADIIRKRVKKPSPRHINILRLFPSTDQIRLVSTNFDPFLTKAAQEIDVEYSLIEYFAPALPVGYEFKGIVYLHGRIDESKSTMVLTDRDFGRAYLTDGWARRFLLEMFSQYTVLFIGYSHRDIVMQYLARGLPIGEETQRFAFTPQGNTEFWEHLGITSIPYTVGGPWRKHENLNTAIEAWAYQTSLGETGLVQRVKRITENPEVLDGKLSLNDEDRDIITRFLSNKQRIPHFVRHAKSPVWLDWVNSEGLLGSLFSPSTRLGKEGSEQSIQYLARWVTGFIAEHSEYVLSVIEQHHLDMHPILLNEFVRELAYADKYSVEVYEIWIPILLAVNSYRISLGDFINSFVSSRGDKQIGRAAIILFEHITQPHLSPKKKFKLFEAKSEDDHLVDYEVTFIEGHNVDSKTLGEFWNLYLRPDLNEYMDELEPLVTNRLHRAHSLLDSVSKVDEDWDRHSISRSAIERHDQDRYGTDLDPLINAGRDIIEYRVEHELDKARHLIDTWIGSGVPLLRRLAIHGMKSL